MTFPKIFVFLIASLLVGSVLTTFIEKPVCVYWYKELLLDFALGASTIILVWLVLVSWFYD